MTPMLHMSTGVPYGVDLRISGATSTKTEAQKEGETWGPTNNISIYQSHDSHPRGKALDCWLPVALLALERIHSLFTQLFHASYGCSGLSNFTDGKRTDRQRDGIQERLQDFVERQKACLVVKPLEDPSNVVSVMPNLSPYATTALIASHLVSCNLTSWCAALGLEQLRAGIVLLCKAKVGDLEVGVVLLVHQEQVLRLKRGASKKKKTVARK